MFRGNRSGGFFVWAANRLLQGNNYYEFEKNMSYIDMNLKCNFDFACKININIDIHFNMIYINIDPNTGIKIKFV